MKVKLLIVVVLSFILLNSFVVAKEYDVAVGISPTTLDVNPCGIATFDVTIQNTGEKKDSYAILVRGIPEGWYALSHPSVTLEPKQSRTIYLFMTIDCYTELKGLSGSVITSGLSENSASFSLNIFPDHALKVDMPDVVSSCLCETTTMTATVENFGEFAEEVTLGPSDSASSIATLSQNSFTLQPKEKKDVTITLNPTCGAQPSDLQLKLSAISKSSYAKSADSSVIERINCHDLRVLFTKENVVCSKETKTFTIEITNVGTKEDTFRIDISALNYGESFTLPPGQTKTVNVDFVKEQVGTFDVGFNVKSSFKSSDYTAKFIVEKCYGVDLQPEQNEFNVLLGESKLLMVKILNTGTKSDTFTISSDVSWISIRPTSVSLEGNESKDVFVYYSPAFGMKGMFDTSLTAKSDKSEDKEIIKANVTEKEIPVIVITVPAPLVNVTTTLPTTTLPAGRFVLPIENKLLLSLIVGIIAALVILAVIYFAVMRG